MSEHNLITIKHMYKAKIGILMFKYHKNLLPQSFNKIFIQKSFYMKTKSSSNVVTSFCRFTLIQQSLKFIGPKVWNNIPLIVRDSTTGVGNCFCLQVVLRPWKLTEGCIWMLNLFVGRKLRYFSPKIVVIPKKQVFF